MSIASAVAAPMMTALLAAIDAAGPAYWRVYAGTRPSSGGTPTGSLIAQLALNNPSGAVSGPTLTFTGPFLPAPILAAESPTWARLHDGSGSYIMDVKARLSSVVDDPGDPAALVVTATALALGEQLQISTAAVSLG